MKTLWNVICVLLLLHVLAAVAFVGWLRIDGRLNGERVRRIYDTFSTTIAQEEAARQEESILAKDMQEKIEHMAWLQKVAAGPQTMLERLEAVQQTDEVSNTLYERMRREVGDFQTLFANTEALLAAERAAIEEQRAALAQELEREKARRESDDFKQAKELYEQLKPKQTKQMFQQLIAQNKLDEVVDYLAAMQTRKAAAILGEFKTPDEIPQGTQLLERLRSRGIDLNRVAPPPATAMREGTAT